MNKIFIASLALALALVGCGPRQEMLDKIELAKNRCVKLPGQCVYKKNENYHIFLIDTFDSLFAGIVRIVLVESLVLPPNVLAKLYATNAIMGLQEESMEGANVSWDISVEPSSDGEEFNRRSITFNVIL